MSVRVAYGSRTKINDAILSGVIPLDTIIITNDDSRDAELKFLDANNQLKCIVDKTHFDSAAEAAAYIETYKPVGQTISVFSDGAYNAYIVQKDCVLEPVGIKGVAPDAIIELINDVKALLEAEHSHGNKAILDIITEERISRWDDPFGTDTEGIIESVRVGGDALEISDRAVDIPIATAVRLGVVKSSSDENGISIGADGTMSVNDVNFNRIVQSDGEEVVFFCGASNN